jgi:predicted TIM-barrel enzyme
MSTRSERRADSNARTVRYSRRAVHRALTTGHVGRERAISGRDLAEYVPVAYTTVRDVIAELRDDPAGPPIGSCADGYYVIATDAELEDYVAGMNETIQTKRERLQANLEAYNRRHQ